MSGLANVFDLSQFDEYREDNRREVKKAKGGLPISLWDTYSAFANCYGGVIILGVKEEKDGSWKTTGLQNASKLRKEFWDTINNSKKVNINLLSEDDVQTYEIGDSKDVIMVIYVPMAKREQKPVYINDDIWITEKSQILPHAGVTDCSPVPVNGLEMCAIFISGFITKLSKMLKCHLKCRVVSV